MVTYNYSHHEEEKMMSCLSAAIDAKQTYVQHHHQLLTVCERLLFLLDKL